MDAHADDASPAELWEPATPHRSLLDRLRDPAGSTSSEPNPRDGADLKFAPGALDGILSRHGGAGLDPDALDAVETGAAVVTALGDGTLTREQLLELYAVAQTCPPDAPRALAARLESALAAGTVRTADVLRLGGWLLHGAHTGPVRLGLGALASLPDLAGYRDDVVDLAADDDLTHDAIVALLPELRTGSAEDAYRTIAGIARRVTGWGRIWAVDVLVGTRDPDQRRWLLTEGFRNDVMWEYSAHLVATHADLLGHLRALPAAGTTLSDDDQQLLDSAGDLLGALLAADGQAPGYAEYADARDATLEFFARVAALPEDRVRSRHLAVAVDVLNALDPRWSDLDGDAGWTVEQRSAIGDAARRLLNHPAATSVVHRDLSSPDRAEAFHAERVARTLGIDVWEALVARVHADPNDFGAWSSLSSVTGERAEQVAAMADSLIDLEELARPSAPVGLMGNPGVIMLLQNLVIPNPGFAPRFLLASLSSPAVAHRHRALNALEQWPRDQWPDGADDRIDELARYDEEPGVRERAAQLLQR